MSSVNLTVAQAVVESLGAQSSDSDAVEQQLSAPRSSNQPVRMVYDEHKATQKLFL